MVRFFPHTNKNLPDEIKKALTEGFKETDKILLFISFLSFLGTSIITSYSHNTYFLGIVGGGTAFGLSMIAYVFYRGTLIARLLFGIIFMMYPSIMLQQQLGMIEMHFAFFYMISFLMMYRDVSSILIAICVGTFHHVSLTYLQLNNVEVMGVPLLVFGPNCSWTITMIHMSMWLIAMLVYMYMVIKNTRNFIKIRLDNMKLIQQADKLDELNLTLEQKVSQRTFELFEQKHIFETLFNETTDGITLIKDGDVIDCNNAVLKLLEYTSKDEFLKLHPYQLSPEFQPDGQTSKDKANEKIKICLEKGSNRFEWVHRKATGEDFWAEIVLTKIKIKNEAIIHGVWRDITHRKYLDEQIIHRTEDLEQSNEELEVTLENLKQTQEQLLESKKMESLGNLVSGVAHEINTPVGIGITGITHFIEITKEITSDYKSDSMSAEEFEQYLDSSASLAEMVNKNLNRTARLIKSFKQIAVDQVIESKRDFDLIEYLEGVIHSLHNEIKDTKIKINTKSSPALILNSYPGVFSQIFTNLILNSIYHAYNQDEKGTILIELSKDEGKLKIVYNDDGKGISSENLLEIFEPFFTTDRLHGRTGLGLNVVYNILTNKLNGTIKCESKEEEWTRFIISIPL